MKTKKQKTKKSIIEQLREIRDQISAETQNMTFEQLRKYIDERLTLHPISAWKKKM